MATKKSLRHPMQPIGVDKHGVVRFKPNAIIEWLFETGKLDMNLVAVMAGNKVFNKEDQMQLAQLLGYSVSGYGDLSYVSRESLDEADNIAEKLMSNQL